MQNAGFDPYLYEDFVEETVELFNLLAAPEVIENKYNDKPLLEVFTSQEKSDAIVTHLKVCVSYHFP